MPNPVTHFQILSPSPDEHAAFYRNLFGWSIDAANPLGYRQLDTGSERGIQGGIWPAPPQAAAMIQLFIEVEDLEASVQKAVELQSKVIIPPQTLPAGERLAVLLDPHGLAFALTQPKKS